MRLLLCPNPAYGLPMATTNECDEVVKGGMVRGDGSVVRFFRVTGPDGRVENVTLTVRKATHCPDCGNPDCPQVSASPYWRRCPASQRLGTR